jgi:acrylyl-CoA reductase (NADPH)
VNHPCDVSADEPVTFPALYVTEAGTPAKLVELGLGDLDPGEVTIAVEWSSLNYKDVLAVTGTAPVVRRFPMICGIDLAGKVTASTDPRLAVGSDVLVTGDGLGTEHSGGYAPLARVPSSWCVPTPDGLDGRRAMALGTAGLTAMLAFLSLETAGSGPDELDGLPLLVTGAAGGVGTLSVLIGSRLGYDVVASTGRPDEAEYLRRLGAAEVVDRSELSDAPHRPLAHPRFGAAVDVVGGTTLANVIASTRPLGAVAATGLVGGAELVMTVHPFILRGVTLAGINSQSLPMTLRQAAWERLATVVPHTLLDAVTEEINLGGVLDIAPAMLAGRVRGRVVVTPRTA